jgi:hypothetical protein
MKTIHNSILFVAVLTVAAAAAAAAATRYALQERAARSVLLQKDPVQSGRKDSETLSLLSLQ